MNANIINTHIFYFIKYDQEVIKGHKDLFENPLFSIFFLFKI